MAALMEPGSGTASLESLARHARGTPAGRPGRVAPAEARCSRGVAAELAKRGAHLAALTAFALAQPLFDILGRHPAFFAVRGSTRREIVLFAVVVALGPPVALAMLAAAARAVGPRAGAAVHLLLVGLLAGAIALQVAHRAGGAGTLAALVAACLAGALAALAYVRWTLSRTLLTALAPAPVVFALLFLFASPVTPLVLPETVQAHTAAGVARTPVVLVVFDELSTTWLLDRRGRIDAERFPAFASLARNGLWFPNATTVHAHTEAAVPAILTGRTPGPRELPVLADHPQNLFTMLGPRYRIRAIETLTRLCPERLCHRGRRTSGAGAGASAPAWPERAEGLAADSALVLAHTVLPPGLTARLPSIADAWGDFRGGDATHSGGAAAAACGRGFCRFARLVDSSRRPTLYFFHALLPHVPWQFFPTGERYANDVRRIPGMGEARWTRDPVPVRQGHQRALLQLGYTDRALGQLLRRLRSTGVYDRALVIVTADHGAAFTPGEPRRLATRRNLAEIAFVPLLVKPPHSRSGRTVGGPARSVDVLPTIADVLDLRVPRRMEGRSLLRPRPAGGLVRVAEHGGVLEERLSVLVRERQAFLRRQVALFGTGPFARVYRASGRAALVGRSMATFRLQRAQGEGATVDGTTLLRVDARSDLRPAYVTGRTRGVAAGTDLAVAVDGAVAAVTTTYEWLGETRFGAILPPHVLTPGDHTVAVYRLAGAGASPGLVELAGRGSSGSFSLTTRGGRTVLVAPAGRVLRVAPRAFAGAVRLQLRRSSVLFSGWAVDRRARRGAETVVVFAGDAAVFAASAQTFDRADVRARFGVRNAGFLFELPRTLLGGTGRTQLRVFVVGGGRATQLRRR